MGFILKYVIIVGLLYVLYRKLDKRFSVVEKFSANVVGKFTKKNGKKSEGDASEILDVKDVWKHFLVLKEEALPVEPDEVVGEVTPEAEDSNITEEVSDDLYNKVQIGDLVTVKVSYSRWTKKIIKTEVIPGFKDIGDEDK